MAVNKLNVLLKQEQKLFHTTDLGLLWNISNLNTLYTTISRLVRKRVLFAVQKGLYSVVPLEHLESIQVGIRVLHRYVYVSTETVLAEAGLISQITYAATFISDISRKFHIGQYQYLARSLRLIFLHNTAGIFTRADGILIATVERAVADMRYFQPGYHFDGNSRIDWEKVKQIQTEVGYV